MTSKRTAVLVFLAGTLVGLYFAIQAYYNPALQPQLRWSEALAVNLVFYYLWACTTPIVIAVARRFPLDGARWGISLGTHAVMSCVLTAVEIVIGEAILMLLRFRVPAPLQEKILRSFAVNFQSSLPTYWLILFAYLAFDYYVKYRDREVRAAQLNGQLSLAQLHALKMQLKPHFLFNTLNSVSSLMYTDVAAADAMLARLSDFLRLTLDRELDQEITLKDELEFVRRYLEIEKIRFEDRLAVKIDVEPGIDGARIPTMALQPLVENAIHHGISRRPQGGTIAITARVRDGRLHVRIADDGAGPVGEGEPVEHIGLANTRARLERLYGDEQRFTLDGSPGGGFSVEIVIPFHLTEVS